jgi:hypothetical protein
MDDEIEELVMAVAVGVKWEMRESCSTWDLEVPLSRPGVRESRAESTDSLTHRCAMEESFSRNRSANIVVNASSRRWQGSLRDS